MANQRRWEAKLERLVAKLGILLAQLGRWVAKLGRLVAKSGRWVAKLGSLVAKSGKKRLICISTEAIWVPINTTLKNK